ncbi:MAG TPA: aldose 1-epimerase family protein [Solirubrobacteraceae bacterium]|nr:aldose 1-epimerase family protein [Solirubrobacteraceae bacterium]
MLPTDSGQQIELSARDAQLTVAAVGASLRRLTVGGWDLLDGYGTDEIAAAAQAQVLVPWPNRIVGGRYSFGGESLQLPLTEPEAGHAIHGLARWAAWAVAERSATRVALTHLIAPQAGYPFALAVEVVHELTGEGVRTTTTAENVGRRPLPYGSGFHPYLRVTTGNVDDAILELPAVAYLASDEDGIPTGERCRVDGSDYDFRRAQAIGDTQLDTAFCELDRDDDGIARVTLAAPSGERSVTLWMDAQHPYVMAFTGDSLPEEEQRRRSLGLEPMTCPPNAFASGEDVRVLEPGERASATWGLEF